ncbi:U-box domain-containing protein [Thermoproteota archaeon]
MDPKLKEPETSKILSNVYLPEVQYDTYQLVVRYHLGLVSLNTGEYSDAIGYFSSAFRIKPSKPLYNLYLASFRKQVELASKTESVKIDHRWMSLIVIAHEKGLISKRDAVPDLVSFYNCAMKRGDVATAEIIYAKLAFFDEEQRGLTSEDHARFEIAYTEYVFGKELLEEIDSLGEPVFLDWGEVILKEDYDRVSASLADVPLDEMYASVNVPKLNQLIRYCVLQNVTAVKEVYAALPKTYYRNIYALKYYYLAVGFGAYNSGRALLATEIFDKLSRVDGVKKLAEIGLFIIDIQTRKTNKRYMKVVGNCRNSRGVCENNLLAAMDYLSGYHWLTIKNYKEAANIFGLSLNRMKDSINYTRMYVEASLQIGKIDETFDSLKSLYQAQLCPPDLLIRLRDITWKKNLFDEANDYNNKLLETMPQESPLFQNCQTFKEKCEKKFKGLNAADKIGEMSDDTIVQIPAGLLKSLFIDPIMFTPMSNPMITPSGKIYDKSTLENCVKDGVISDPLTRDVYTMKQCKPITEVRDLMAHVILETP